jgi:hypothetical protein
MPSIAFEQTPHCLVAVMGRDNPPDAEWDAYVAAIDAGLGSGRPPRALVVSDGGAPSPAQRKRLDAATAQAGRQLKAAILTGSTFVRGVVNAFALIQPGYRAFAPAALADAVDYLGIRAAHLEELRSTIARLRVHVG